MRLLTQRINSKFRHLRWRSRKTLFDSDYYLDVYKDVELAGVDPYQHYLEFGVAEGRNPNFWFDTAYYLSQTKDKPRDPTLHYLKVGAAIGLNPHPQFDTTWYLKNYADVAKARMNPLEHFLRYGADEERKTAPRHLKLFGTKPNSMLLTRAGKAEFQPAARHDGSGEFVGKFSLLSYVTPAQREAWIVGCAIASEVGDQSATLGLIARDQDLLPNFGVIFRNAYLCMDPGQSVSVCYAESLIFSIVDGAPKFLGAFAGAMFRYTPSS